MTWEEMVDKAIEYFEENDYEFYASIEALDSNRGYLEEARREPMDYLNDWCYGWTVKEIMQEALSGCDEYGGNFDPDREYFYRRSWGGLISTDDYDYSDYLDKWFIESLFDHYVYYLERDWRIDTDEDPEFIRNLFDEYIAEHGMEKSV